MTNKRLVILVVVIFGFILVINHFVSERINSVKDGLKSKKNSSVVQKKGLDEDDNVQVKVKYKKAWKETNPEELKKYGITVTQELYSPSSAEAWEGHIEKNLEDFKVLEKEGAKEALELMQVTREEYEDKMKKIEEDIDIVKKRLEDDPFNEKYKTQLQNIYKIKAVGKILERNGVVIDKKAISEITSETK